MSEPVLSAEAEEDALDSIEANPLPSGPDVAPDFAELFAEPVPLKPCPFCGGPAKRSIQHNGTPQTGCAGDYAECAGTDVLAPVALWNKRAPGQIPREVLVKALEERAESCGVPERWAELRNLAIMVKSGAFPAVGG